MIIFWLSIKIPFEKYTVFILKKITAYYNFYTNHIFTLRYFEVQCFNSPQGVELINYLFFLVKGELINSLPPPHIKKFLILGIN